MKINSFGVLVLVGIVIGARVMRRYAARRGVAPQHLDGLMTWMIACGFIGAHVFEVLMYRPEAAVENPLLLLEIWGSLSSYGGFLGGSIGFVIYTRWKRLRIGPWADVATVGLLLAFTIGRIGCTTVHDHIGAATDFALGFDFPRSALAQRGILDEFASNAPIIRAHDLAFYELLYLILVNAVIMWLAFKGTQRAAGLLAVLAGLLYASVRFFLDFLRLETTDRPIAGLTFAQWCSIAVVVIASLVAIRLFRSHPIPTEVDGGRPAG